MLSILRGIYSTLAPASLFILRKTDSHPCHPRAGGDPVSEVKSAKTLPLAQSNRYAANQSIDGDIFIHIGPVNPVAV